MAVLSGRNGIIELIRCATGQIVDANSGDFLGSGFFYAPGVMLTAAHVVRGRIVAVRWRGAELPIDEVVCTPPLDAPEAEDEHPDLAVLRLVAEGAPVDHPCAPGHTTMPSVDAEVYIYGFSKARTGETPEPTGARTSVMATTPHLVQMHGMAPEEGVSGGPVIDLGSFKVVGVQRSRSDGHPGGWFTPLAALPQLDPGLQEANDTWSEDLIRQLRAAQKPLAEVVDAVVRSVGGVDIARRRRFYDMIIAELLRVDATVPRVQPGDDAVAEWAGRLLLVLDKDAVVSVLDQAVLEELIEAHRAVSLLDLALVCVPTGELPAAWWVMAETAEAYRLETQQPAPRLLCLRTNEIDTAKALLRRVHGLDRGLRDCRLPSGADVDPVTGVQRDLISEYIAVVLRVAIGYDSAQTWWTTRREKCVKEFNQRNHAIVLTAAHLDERFVLGLAEELRGLRVLLCGRTLEPPAGTEEALAELPEIHNDAELSALICASQARKDWGGD